MSGVSGPTARPASGGRQDESPPRNAMKDSLPYFIGTPVRVRKLCTCENPLVGPGSWADWKPGEQNNLSLPTDYELRGFLLQPVEIGKMIVVYRTHRNGLRVDGLFRSTFVCDIEKESVAVTYNSRYQVIPDASLARVLME